MSAFADRVQSEDRASVQRAVEIALERREAFDIDFRVQLPEGGIRWVNCKGAVYRPRFPGHVVEGKSGRLPPGSDEPFLAHLRG